MQNQPRTDRTLQLGLIVLLVVLVVGWLGWRSRGRSTETAGSPGPVAAGPASADAPWPGSIEVAVVDDTSVFHTNLSGLAAVHDGPGSAPALWAVQNGPGTLYLLRQRGDRWVPDSASSWAAGKRLRYPDDGGNVDAEGLAVVGTGTATAIYLATERNNDANTVSRNSILRFAPAGSSPSLRATHEWQLTGDLPPVAANLGLESITWVPDSVLVAGKFHDEAAGRAYVPADHPDHGTGLFFVGLEKNGMIYVYALNHVTNGFTRIASLPSGNAGGVMALEYDRESGQLWATCDDTCGNTATILAIDTVAQSTTRGRFLPLRRFARPPSLPNVNNEGFTIATGCVRGHKDVFWADDSDTGGHSIRRASLPCGPIR